jgi:hypothetical protein
MTSITKVDLHAHCPIDFDPRWLAAQGYNPDSLLKDIVENCYTRELDAFALISAYDYRLKSNVLDRFKHLCDLSKLLPENYTSERLGKNVLIVEKESKRVLIINGQSTQIKENGEELESLVIGSNHVPEGMSIRDTGAYCKDNGLIFIAEHPASTRSGGIGLERFGEHSDDYTAGEGHNSQLIYRFPLSILPLFNQYARSLNKKTQKFCEDIKKPWVAASDSHRIEDTGISYIELNNPLNLQDGESVVQSLKTAIECNSFENVCNYESFFNWASWTRALMKGGIKD